MAKTYRIQQPTWLQSNYLIFDGEGQAEAGRLEYKGWFQQRASGTMGSQSWRFVKRTSLTRSQVDVVPADNADDSSPVLTYSCAALRQTGSLELHGQQLTFAVASLRSHYRWLDTDGNELAIYKMHGIFKRSGTIEVGDTLLKIEDYEILIPLGLYLGMNVESTNAAAAGSVAAVSVAVSS